MRALDDSLAGIIAVVRADSARAASTMALGLEDTPVSSVEITMTVPDAIEVVRDLTTRMRKPIGLGTVTEATSVEAAVAAGAVYVVSPGLDRTVVDAALGAGVPVVAGALTPTEIMAAWDAGATAVKVFPVSSVGGPSYIRAVRAPLPHIPLIVSGGVRPGDVAAYLEAGATGVALGSSLVDPETVALGDVASVRDQALARLA